MFDCPLVPLCRYYSRGITIDSFKPHMFSCQNWELFVLIPFLYFIVQEYTRAPLLFLLLFCCLYHLPLYRLSPLFIIFFSYISLVLLSVLLLLYSSSFVISLTQLFYFSSGSSPDSSLFSYSMSSVSVM